MWAGCLVSLRIAIFDYIDLPVHVLLKYKCLLRYLEHIHQFFFLCFEFSVLFFAFWLFICSTSQRVTILDFFFQIMNECLLLTQNVLSWSWVWLAFLISVFSSLLASEYHCSTCSFLYPFLNWYSPYSRVLQKIACSLLRVIWGVWEYCFINLYF